MTAEQLHQIILQGETPIILDVRSAYEFRQGHIRGACHAPLIHIVDIVRKLSTKDRVMILVCEHGPRAILAYWMLRLRGFNKLKLLEGHMSNWRRSVRLMANDKHVR